MNKFRTIALILCAALAQLAAAATDDLPPFYQELLPDGAWFKLAGQSWVWQPYVCEGSAFGETAVAQLAGPAEDRVGIEPVVALYTLAPITYETAPTIIIRDRRDSLWLPAPYGGYGHPFRYPSGWRYHPPRGCH